MITDADGRLLFCGQTRPGAIHDLTQVRQAGLVDLLALTPGVTLLAGAGYQGLSAQTVGAVLTPCPARRKIQLPVMPALAAAHEAERQAHASPRPTRAPDTIPPAVAGLVSSQERTPRPEQLRCPPKALPAGTAR